MSERDRQMSSTAPRRRMGHAAVMLAVACLSVAASRAMSAAPSDQTGPGGPRGLRARLLVRFSHVLNDLEIEQYADGGIDFVSSAGGGPARLDRLYAVTVEREHVPTVLDVHGIEDWLILPGPAGG